MNLRGSIDLLKLNNVWAGKIESKKQPGTKVDVLIIPVRDNDIYQSVDEATGKLKSVWHKIKRTSSEITGGAVGEKPKKKE